jgi:nitroimidazol reductase NimA-like FMN-containing flavoprotein (pyridoxamine 5'-phosphate oxidase superfamily)
MNPVPIPESHRDLLDGTYCATLTTVMPDGQPQITPVWYSREGDYILLNTMRGFRKEKNMRANPKVMVNKVTSEHSARRVSTGTKIPGKTASHLIYFSQTCQLRSSSRE